MFSQKELQYGRFSETQDLETRNIYADRSCYAIVFFAAQVPAGYPQ